MAASMADDVTKKIINFLNFLSSTSWMTEGSGEALKPTFDKVSQEIKIRLERNKADTAVTVLLGIYEWLKDSADKIEWVCRALTKTEDDEYADMLIDDLVADFPRSSPFQDLTDPIFSALESDELYLDEKKKLLRYCQYFLACAVQIKMAEEEEEEERGDEKEASEQQSETGK